MLEPQLAAMVKEYDNVVAKKIDLTKRGCEAGQQMVRDYQQRTIPYHRIFGTEGEFLGAAGADLNSIRELIEPQGKKR